MTSIIEKYRINGLPIGFTDEELCGIGAIAIQWAHAERAAASLLAQLVGTEAGFQMNLPPEESISWERKTRNIKKLLRATCATFPKHLEIGIALISVGKELANERKIITHWVLGHKEDDTKLRFVKGTLPPAPLVLEYSHWTQEDLFALAEHLRIWVTDTFRYSICLMVNGPLASRTTWHGPKPPDVPPSPDEFQTIGKNRLTSTRGKRKSQL